MIVQQTFAKDEDIFIASNYPKMKISDIAVVLGRTRSSVAHRIQRLGVAKKVGVYKPQICRRDEKWIDIKGYEGRYQVSNTGLVKSVRKGILMSPYEDKDGYLRVSLHNGEKSKQFCIHRLVAIAFIDNPSDLPLINHKDENRKNNAAENLEWCTAKYNVNYGDRAKKYADSYHGEQKYNSKLTERDVLFIRKNYTPGDKEYGQAALARKFGVDRMTVKSALIRRTWKHI